jgi:hypothetical protein
MKTDLPLSAWLVLGCLGVFILIVNVSLFTALRGKKNNSSSSLQRVVNGARSTWRRPFKSEDAELHELSQKVADLQSPPDLPHPPQT